MKIQDCLGEAFAILGLPAWIIDDACVVISANSLTIDHSTRVSGPPGRSLRVDDGAAAQFLSRVMTLGPCDENLVRSFPLKDADGSATEILHVVPVRGAAREIFPDCSAAIFVTSIKPLSAPVELLQSVFGLTPAETEVARCIALGQSVDHISAHSGTSPNTVRSHLRRVLEKTQCSRQTQVVALFAGISFFSAVNASCPSPLESMRTSATAPSRVGRRPACIGNAAHADASLDGALS